MLCVLRLDCLPGALSLYDLMSHLAVDGLGDPETLENLDDC